MVRTDTWQTTMAVKFIANGERRRGFRETVDEFTVTEMDGLYEPRTCLPYLQAVKSVAESSYGQHLAWKQQCRIPEGKVPEPFMRMRFCRTYWTRQSRMIAWQFLGALVQI